MLDRWEGHSKGVNRVAPLLQQAGGSLAAVSASRDCTLKLWQRGVPGAVATLSGHSMTVSALCVPGSEYVVSGGRDNSVRLWDLATAKEMAKATVARKLSTFLSACGSSEPSLVVEGSEDLRLRLWDLRTMGVAHTIEPALQYFALCGDVSSDGHYVLVGCNGFSGAGCEVRLYDRRREGTLALARPHQHAVTACAFLPRAETGGLVCACASKDGSVTVLDFLAQAAQVAREGAMETAVVHRLQPAVAGQLTALAAIDQLALPQPVSTAAPREPTEQSPSIRTPCVLVGTPRGSVHSLALHAASASLREVCFTAPLPPQADED